MKMKLVGLVGKNGHEDIYLFQCPKCKNVNLEGFCNEEYGAECVCDIG